MSSSMANLNVQPGKAPSPAAAPSHAPLWDMGFRPFFLGAVVYSAIAMGIWLSAYALGMTPPGVQRYGSLWHAHEMIFGYSAAVIAGFLLTAARNWTGLPTLERGPLALLFALWAGARIAFCVESTSFVAPALDFTFNLMLIYAVARPIVKARQWRQLGILTKLVLLGVGNGLFFLGAWNIVDNGMRLSVVAGIYIIIGLVLTMARRLIPFFTERGVGEPLTLRNSSVLDGLCLAAYLAFFILELFTSQQRVAGLFAGLLCVLHAVRLTGWYTPAIRPRPLLWSLHLSYALMVVAFALQSAAAFGFAPATLALHMFALGGIGIITISMMVRVSIGHTGRNVHAPPPLVKVVLALAVASLVARVLLPLLLPAQYFALVVTAQVLWIASFAVLAWLLAPILLAPRADAT
ncbi:MAG: NnrS family protein [Proteobacteria bacterium]|nr:NnrS family protein [Pseudomonadota bacterium]